MAEIIASLEGVRDALESLVIDLAKHDAPWGFIEPPYAEFQETWNRVANRLAYSLERAERQNLDLRQALYHRGLQGLGIKRNSRKPSKAEQQAPVNPKVQKAYDFIKARGPVKGVLVANHAGIADSTFRKHYVPKLYEMGVKNDGSGDGYYVPSG